LEETQPFESNVIAYPAITTISNSININKPTKIYTIKNLEKLNLIISSDQYEEIRITQNKINWFSDDLIPIEHLKYFNSIENEGFKIGIGVATGSDKIFISETFDDFIEQELLLPIITSKELKKNTFTESKKKIINPFTSDGKLINLSQFPKAKKYLLDNKSILSKRHIAKKNPIFWFKTIDKIKPSLRLENKILLPDISGNKVLFIDEGKYYPHHNLYYITGKGLKTLKVLAAILMSDFSMKQLLTIGNKMNGGYPRWQSQNLRKLRIPIIENFNKEYKDCIASAYDNFDPEKLNRIITLENILKNSSEKGQIALFEPTVEYKK